MTIEELTRIKCYKSFSFFTRYFFKTNHKRKFIVGEHHQTIIDALERVRDGSCRRLIINIAPRYGKTELAVKNFIAYGLATNPKAKFIHLSYSDQLALDNSEEIKDLVNTEEYQKMFPYVQIKKDSRAKNKWYTTEGGGVLARSASGQVTGFGAGQVEDEDSDFEELFGGAIIIDDPIKPDDANSETIREKVNNRFETTIRNRVNSRNTPIIVIMQRLNEQDLCGHLLGVEPDEWEVISLPVLKPDGTALWEFKHTVEELQELRRIDEFVFDTQYMQDPKPKEGLLFAKEDLHFFDEKLINSEEMIGRIAFVDVADQGEDNHCVPIGEIHNGRIYIIDVVFTKDGTDLNVDYTANLLNKHKPEYCRVESNFGGSMYVSLLSQKVTETMLLPIPAKGNKHARITQLAGFIKDHCYFKEDFSTTSDYGKFMNNLTRYTKNGKGVKHDDAPDAMHGLTFMARSFHPDIWKY